ncbi:unnamed protein product [Caenorhabditis auriculariae]|uniref:Clc-like protein n=1 Tax=Caenorhabditis auriculariae TaxID=2777116 RepID=A0A8S1H5V6_9PELO|nr:unnamed protein product [Caenorhabditis auriculariae]
MLNRRMSTTNELARKGTLTVALVLSLIGMGLSIAAILTPSWQVVNLREYNSIHEHGLWLDCTRHSRDGNHILQRYATVTEPLHCVYKFDYDKYSGTFDLEDDNSPVGEVNRHKFYGWHTATMILLGFALLTSFLSTCIGICSCCYGSLSLIFTGFCLITTFLSTVAEGIFFFYSHRADNRFIKGIVGTYEQRVGLAFFLEMAAAFFHFFSFLAAMLFTYFSFAGAKDSMDGFSLQRSSRTNVTNIGRSMEFDAPLMYPPHTPVPNIRYEEKHHVAESMPELGVRGAYPSTEFFPPRVRRKSETCV